MRDFVDTLPLRLAAVVAAIVGAVCLFNGVELWESARRMAIAFVVLLLAGLAARRLILTQMEESTRDPADKRLQRGKTEEETGSPSAEGVSGQNLDMIAPGTSIGELLSDDADDT